MVENNTGNRGFLSDSQNEEGLFPIHGIAIGDNDITKGDKSKETKLWRPDVIQEAADTLEGKKIVVNHENKNAREVIGEITESRYEDGTGVIYRGHIDDEELAGKIGRGWLEVSPRIIHSAAHEMVQGVKIPEFIKEFHNLSVVPYGASDSNEAILGEPEELSAEELQESFEENEEVSEYQRVLSETEVEELQDDVDYAQWLFDNPEGAEGAAERFGCESYHEHEIEGDTYYMPCPDHDTFLQHLRETDSDDMQLDADELQLSEPRTPSFDGTEEVSWDGVPADTLEFWVEALEYGDVSEVDDLSDDQRQEIASHTLLGDPDSDNVRDLRLFPVVNPRSGDLNRNALVAVRGGRGQSADIPQDVYESAFATAGRLLNEEFDADVDEELAEHKDSEMSYNKEESRVASQMASHSRMTKAQCYSIVDLVNPERQADPIRLSDILEDMLSEDEMEVLYAELEGKYKDKQMQKRAGDSILNSVLR